MLIYTRYFDKGKHPTTIVGVYENETEIKYKKRILSIGFSICSPKDVFKKKIGNTEALRMAIWYPFIEFDVRGHKDSYRKFEFVSKLMKLSLNSDDTVKFLNDWKHSLKEEKKRYDLKKEDEANSRETNISV